jgi:hypothetical protein
MPSVTTLSGQRVLGVQDGRIHSTLRHEIGESKQGGKKNQPRMGTDEHGQERADGFVLSQTTFSSPAAQIVREFNEEGRKAGKEERILFHFLPSCFPY